MSFTVRPTRTRTQTRTRTDTTQRGAAASSDTTNHAMMPLGTGHTSALVRERRLAALEARSLSLSASTSVQSVSSSTTLTVESSSLAALGSQQQVIEIDSDSDDDDDDEADYYRQHDVKQPARKRNRTLALLGEQPFSQEFQIATWNVLWEPIHVSIRMKEIARLVKEIPHMWFVGFQEVTEESGSILRGEMEAAGYRIIAQPQSLRHDNNITNVSSLYLVSEESQHAYEEMAENFTGCGFGCMLAVRQLSKDPELLGGGFQAFKETLQGRGFCYAVLRIPNRNEQILVATTHLESIGRQQDCTGATQRAAQLQEFVAFIERAMTENKNLQWALLTGDMNYDETSRNPLDEPMEIVLKECRRPWKDTWLDTKPDDPAARCYTYDGKLNPMRNNGWRSRLDRTLVFSRDAKADQQLVCLGTNADKLLGVCTLLGNSNNSCLTFLKPGGNESPVAPSDHFGFASRLGFDFSE